ncbi:P-loop containing nucleoside triphosphate hydrolase protein [Lasiosphaeria ovina]|uniref:P-loop containing nucleoside triphosphate hydrolase protein n=1 Tax=Lasiosphaeria ovina TaxID=92902 RepID=A0AAE0JVJ3_9PEZI|nr:P-loop containing nucleoside triphosphate hydrolase protein [Lasiosphaeria ovina]
MAVHKLLVPGVGGVGKTALTIQLTLKRFYNPIVEDSYRKETKIDGQACILSIIDTGGAEGLPSLSRDQITNTRAPIMLVGNKTDRVTEREVSTEEGHALARELDCEFVEASAKNGENVEKAILRSARRQWETFALTRAKAAPKGVMVRNDTGGGAATGCVVL